MKKTTLNRVHACARFIPFGCALLVLCVSIAAAQSASQGSPHPTATPPPRPDTPASDKDDPPLGSFEEEIRAKRAIKLAEKDHQENVNRAHEIADIAKDLQKTLKDKKTIDRDCAKKIERLEKLTKKIRNEAGGEDEEVEIVDRPADITVAINQVAESAEALSKAVENTPRQVVSASVIGKANVLLQLIKLLRALDTRP
ncbi:MAG TPA: hypothetical protein VGJ37_08510 [Pyrinomonadaceae bacterium]|jgi:hypothetical protein